MCACVLARYLDALIQAQLFIALKPQALDDVADVTRAALAQHEVLVRERADELERAERAAAQAERAWHQADSGNQPLRTQRLGELWEEKLQHLQQVRERHRMNPVVAPAPLDEVERAELRRWLEHLPSLWPEFTEEQRKTIVRHVIGAIRITSAPDVWAVKIEWVGGAITEHPFWRNPGAYAVVEQATRQGLRPKAIAAQLTDRGIVKTLGPHAGEPYDADSVSLMQQRIYRARSFKDQALRHIHDRALARIPNAGIAGELTALGIPSARGSWSAVAVARVVRRMRKGSVAGLDRLPPPMTLAEQVMALSGRGFDQWRIADELQNAGILGKTSKAVTQSTINNILRRSGRHLIEGRRRRHRGDRGDTPRDAALRRLWAETPSLAAVIRCANEQGLRTRSGNPWRSSVMAQRLAKLGLRPQPKKRAADRANRRVTVPIDPAIRRLWTETPTLAEVTRRANQEGILTKFGNQWNSVTMSQKLKTLGLRAPKPWPASRWRRWAEPKARGGQSGGREPNHGASQASPEAPDTRPGRVP